MYTFNVTIPPCPQKNGSLRPTDKQKIWSYLHLSDTFKELNSERLAALGKPPRLDFFADKKGQ